MEVEQEQKPMRLEEALESDAPAQGGVMRLSDAVNPTNTKYAEMNHSESVQSQKSRGIWEQTRFFLGEGIIKPIARGLKKVPAQAESVWQTGIDNLRAIHEEELRRDGAVFGISKEQFEARSPQQKARIAMNNKRVETLNRAEDVSKRLQKNWVEISERGFSERDPKVWQGSFMDNPSWVRAVAMGMENAPMLGMASAVTFATRSPIAGAAAISVIEASEERAKAREAGESVRDANTAFVLDLVALTAFENTPLAGFMKGGGLPIRTLRGFVQEGTEEAAQQLWTNAVAILGYDETRKLTEGLIESVIAGSMSGGVVGAFSPSRVTEIDGVIENALAQGIDVDEMMGKVTDIVINSGDAITEELYNKLVSERGEVINPFQEGEENIEQGLFNSQKTKEYLGIDDNGKPIEGGLITVISSSGKMGQESNQTGLEGVRKETLDVVKNLSQKNNLPIKITGLTEKGHAEGEISHASGHKVDLRLEPKLNKIVESWGATEERVNNKGSVEKGYVDPDSGAIFWREGNHWDVEVKPSKEITPEVLPSLKKKGGMQQATADMAARESKLMREGLLKLGPNPTEEQIKSLEDDVMEKIYGNKKEDTKTIEPPKPLNDKTIEKIEKEFIEISPDAQERAELELFIQDYMSTETTLSQAVLSEGGIAPNRDGSEAEEYKEIPFNLKNKDGIPLDEMTSIMAQYGYTFNDAEEFRQALIATKISKKFEVSEETKDVVKKYKALQKTEKLTKMEVLRLGNKLSRGLAESKVKSVIRRETGQYLKEPPTVKESQALKRSLKRQEQAARAASRHMKKETTEILKLRRKLRDQPIEAITAPERKEIKEIVSQVRKRMSLEELTALYNQVQVVKERGKAKYKAAKDVKDAQIKATIEILTALHGTGEAGKPPAITSVEREEAGGGFVPQAVRSAQATTLRPFRWMDQMDGGQNFKGAHHKEFYDKENVATEDELRMRDERKELIFGFMRRNNITVDSLYEIAEFDGIKMSVSEMMGIYAAWQHPDNTLAVIYGNNIPIDTMQKVIARVNESPVLKPLADEFVKNFNDPKYFNALNDAFIEYTDGKHELDKVKGAYIPMRRVMLGSEPTEKELADELLQRAGLKKQYAARGETFSRKDIPAEYQIPIKLDLFDLWNQHVDKTSHFITHGNMVREWQRIVNDKDFQNSLLNNKRFGKEYLDVLQRWVNRQANPTLYRSYGQVDKAAATLRQNAAIAYLSFNLVTMGKQIPSLALFLSEIEGKYILDGLSSMVNNNQESIKFIHSKSSQMKNRAIERELEEFKNARKDKYTKILRKIGEAGMVGIYKMDQYITYSGWLGAYKKFTDAGLSESEAAREADKVALRTQTAAHAKDIADLYDTNEILNWFLQFSNQLNNIYGMVTYDIPEAFKQERYDDALRGTIGVALSAYLVWIIGSGRLPEDKDEVQDAFLDQFIAMIPVIGSMINSYRRGFNTISVPALQGVAKGVEAGVDLFKEPSKHGKGRLEKATPKAVEATAATVGLPYAQPKRTIKGAMDLISGETSDMRRLIWSDWSLGQKKKKSGLKYKGRF